jgi:hypothetical protein
MPEISNQSQPPPGEIMRQAERDAIGIPRFSAEAKEALFRFFAPVWEIQTESDDDRIGTPYWSIEGTLRIDTANPVVFEHLSHTRFKGDILTQLNYIIWFPSRPKRHSFDLFGGFLDGLIYRITLDVDGQPLLYDTVHNCGCYHKFYPTARLGVLAKTDYTEPPLILEAPSLNPQTERMVIGLESGPHYVRFLYALNRGQEVDATSYVFADYDLLRSLPHTGGGCRSFFGESGIVSGSERTERYILWPMGVLSPGAMRQWGRHAVAFVGRRHFDDPDLIDKNFKRNENLHRSSQ